MRPIRYIQQAITRLKVLALLALILVAYGPASLKEVWGDPQIEMNIPRLAAIAEAAGKTDLGRSLSRLRADTFHIAARPHSSPRKVAIYYDDISYGPNKMYGQIYSRFTYNLLGHFDIVPAILPISRYKAGDIEHFDVTFYVGTDPSTVMPKVFFSDVVATSKTVVWLGENLYNIPTASDAAFAAKYGFRNYGTLYVGEQMLGTRKNPNFYDVVTYKDVDLTRDAKFDTSFAGVQITDPAKVHVWAQVRNLTSGDAQPYILQSANLWFVAGMPFNALEADRPYLAFCDILHDILGIQHAGRHLAMLRLEDVHAKNPSSSLRELNRFLKARHIPYSIAVIPHYIDPLGRYNHGVPEELPIDGGGLATGVRMALQQAVKDGAKIVMHGYTHQYDPPGSKGVTVSAEGFEFWDKAHDLPPAAETPRWVLSRLARGIAELDAAGLHPDYFEMPHYKASPLTYRLVPIAFARTYQRAAYFSTDLRDVANHPKLAKEQLEQQYPYVIHRDYYGQYIVPENIGYLYYSKGESSVDDLLHKARAITVVRDGIASLFVHPYLFNSDLKDRAWADLARIIDGISALGYQWTNDPDQPDNAIIGAKADPHG